MKHGLRDRALAADKAAYGVEIKANRLAMMLNIDIIYLPFLSGTVGETAAGQLFYAKYSAECSNYWWGHLS
jgi:hypothetical protein